MSLFDQIGAMLGQGQQGAGSVPGQLVALIANQPGGLGGLLEKFQAGGLGAVATSWVGTGQNQPVAPDALHGVLGSDMVQQLAAKTGLPIEQLMPLIAQHLPQVVDGMTPNGQVPAGNQLVAMGMAFLKSRMA